MEQLNKILVVDDERFNINVLADLLKPNYKIMAAINGQQALKAARSASPPDLILLDVMMPEIDGYEVCRQLKADDATREIPIIFVTAMGQESDETKGLELGAADYITKPISPAIVEARVRTQIERKQHLDELHKAYAIINAQKDRMQEELNVGRDIQLSLLPQVFPPFPERESFGLHAFMEAAREVGGDFYDYFFIDEDHLCLCVGDVSGKGVPAALFMAIAKALIKSRAADDLSTASVLTHVNDELEANNEAMMFVTVFLAIIDVRNGGLLYTNAGHNPPYIKRASGEVQALAQRHGPGLGPIGGVAFKEGKDRLGEGDSLLIYTDGVTEAMNPDRALYGDDRLVNLLGSGGFADPTQTIEAVIMDVRDFAAGAEQSDDITMLALDFLKSSEGARAQRLITSMKNDLGAVGGVLGEFEAFAQQSGIPDQARKRVKVAFDELLNNIVSYGFPDGGEHEIEVMVDLLDERLMISITDDGVPFNPFQLESPELESSLEDREVGGLGIHLVRNLMDEVSYKRGVDKNIVTLITDLEGIE
jgi:sigma-B regulation protein RsbU (phosphoserine phosphatase)